MLSNRKNIKMKNKRARSNLDQKENLPKKVKMDNSTTLSNIVITKQLLKKKPAVQSKITMDVSCSIKAMPSFKDLEKMYEDSDDSTDTNIVNTDLTHEPPLLLEKNLTIFDIDLSDSHLKVKRDLEHNFEDTMKAVCKPDLLQDNIYETSSKQSHETVNEVSFIDLCDITTPDCKLDSNSFDNNTELEHFQRNSLIDLEEKNIDNSSDSNKTIEYTLPSNSTFSPLPSTSTDNITIIKNDELFYESLKEVGENNYKDTSIEAPVKNNTAIKNKYDEKYKDGEKNSKKDTIIEAPVKKDTTIIDDDDDDCVIIEDDAVQSKQNMISGTEIIDLEKSIEPDANFNVNDNNNNVEDDVIDIDALISDNQSMLDTFQKSQTKKTHHTNNVVNVAHVIEELESELPSTSACENNEEQPQSTINNKLHISKNNQQDVVLVSISDTTDENRYTRKVLSNLISLGVKYFFERFYGKDGQSGPSSTEQNQSRCIPNITPVNNVIQTHNQPEIICVSENVPETARNSKNSQRKQYPPKKKSTQSSPSPSVSIEPSKNLGDCPICMDVLLGKTIASTVCGHVFCMACLETAIMTNKRCPTCRKIVHKKGYHKIFL